MTVDVKGLLDSLRIPYRERGRNIGRDYLGIKCPFCGDDPSEHMGIHIRTGGYHCWRDDSHSGGHIYYLLRALGVPASELREVLPRFDDGEDKSPKRKVEAALFEGWKSLPPAIEPRHLKYLTDRGFSEPVDAVRIGDIRFSNVGKARWRLLFPMTSLRGIEGWTGRAIHPDCEPRYETECPVADRCIVGSTRAPNLFAVEGPIDALKLNYTLNKLGVVNTAAFAYHGSGLSDNHYRLLVDVRPVRIIVCIDNDPNKSFARRSRQRFGELRMFTRPEFWEVPEMFKDVGEMPVSEITKWMKDNAKWLVSS